jgi:alkylation response protein AidB-like acyl-CoA dehydrogenase
VERRFRPVFRRIAAGAVEREVERKLPFDAVRWLNQAVFGALTVPVDHGGPGVDFRQFFQLLVELAEADSNVA